MRKVSDPTEIEAVTAVYHGKIPVLRIGLVASFFLRNSPSCAERIVQVSRQFIDTYRGHLHWYGEEDVRAQKAHTHLLNFPRKGLLDLDPSDLPYGDFEFYSGNRWDEAPSFALEVSCNGLVSELTMFLPFSMAVHQLSEFRQLVSQSAAHLNPLSGVAGYGISQSYRESTRSDYEDTVHALSQRFSGVEVCFHTADCAEFEAELRKNLSVSMIKSVNWLTILGKDVLSHVDQHKLIDQLSNDVPVERLGETIIIQAGDTPRTGDRNQQEDMSLYRRVAGALRPLISKPYQEAYQISRGLDEPAFGVAATNAWRRRFLEK